MSARALHWTTRGLVVLALAVLAGCSAGLPSVQQIRTAPTERLAGLLPPLEARVKSHPDDDDALRRLALLELRMGRAQAALVHARRAAKAAPFSAQSYLVLGEAFQAAGNLSGALASYVQATSLEPALVAAYLRYAQVKMQQHDDEKALHALQEALRRDPHYFAAHMLQARVLWRQGHLAQAIGAVESARAERPNDAGALLLHVELLDAAGHVDTALKLVRVGLQRTPNDRALQGRLVNLLREKEEWSAALQVLTRLAAEAPLTLDAELLRVQVLEGAGYPAEADRALAAILKAHPKSAQAHVLHAKRLALADEAQQAMREAQQAIALAPEAGEGHYWEAVAHFELGEGDLGDAALAAAESAEPNRLAVRLVRIERMLAAYHPGSAAGEIGALLKAHPGFSPALLLQSASAALAGHPGPAEQALERIPPGFAPRQVSFARLRIAYLQSDWARVLTLSEPLLANPLLGWRAAYLRGDALLHQGRWSDGLAAIQPYLQGAGARMEFFRLAGYLHLLQGDRDGAARAFQAGLALNPDSPLMIEGLSRLALENRDWSQAEALLKRGLKAPGPYRWVFLERLAQAAKEAGDSAQSRSALQRFLDATDPVKSGARSTPASDVLYGGYYPSYDLAVEVPAQPKQPPPSLLPDTLIAGH